MFKNVVLSIALLLAYSCGKNGDSNKSLKINYVNSSLGEPILLDKKADNFICPSLISSNLNLDITNEFHTSWSYLKVPFHIPLRSKGGLVKNSLISDVFQSGKMTYTDSRVKGNLETVENEAPELFRSCPGHDYSEDNTYEAASTNTMFSFVEIEKSIQPLGLKLKPVTLRVAPVVEYVQEYYSKKGITREKGKLVNNAFYFAKKNEIVFLPQGKNTEGKIPFSGVPLWKIPFVGVHEYGHHLFTTLVPNHFKNIGHHHDHGVSLCFDNAHNASKSNSNEDGSPRKVAVSDVLDFINEGVADLFARTVLERKYNLSGIGCFEYTRDVEHPRLANWDLKQLDSKVLDRFLLNKRVITENCYKEQDYQDPHIVGTIVAHGLFRLYEQAKLNKTQRIKAMVDWLKDLNQNYQAINKLSPKEAITKSIYLGTKAVTDKYSIARPELCKIVESTFPMLQKLYECK